jgi:hypothetical protein
MQTFYSPTTRYYGYRNSEGNDYVMDRIGKYLAEESQTKTNPKSCRASFVIFGRFQRLDYRAADGRMSGDELRLETSGRGLFGIVSPAFT